MHRVNLVGSSRRSGPFRRLHETAMAVAGASVSMKYYLHALVVKDFCNMAGYPVRSREDSIGS